MRSEPRRIGEPARFYLSITFDDIFVYKTNQNLPIGRTGGNCQDGVATFWEDPNGRVSLTATAVRNALRRAVKVHGLPDIDFGNFSDNEITDSLVQISRFWSMANEMQVSGSATFKGHLNLWRGGTLTHGIWQFLLQEALPYELRTRSGVGPMSCVLARDRTYDTRFLTSKIPQVIRGAMQELRNVLATDPTQILEIEHRDFERISAIVAEDLGFDVQLTRGSKDGGKDLVLRCRDDRGQARSIYVEVKHWSSGKKVGPQELEKLFMVIARDHVDGGLLISTSGFTDPARKLLSGSDKADIIRLIELGEMTSYMREYAPHQAGERNPESLLWEIIRRPLR
ncbi:restriction endonuclease [Streptosporangium oxazolinicum]